jgi:hypothetical protein
MRFTPQMKSEWSEQLTQRHSAARLDEKEDEVMAKITSTLVALVTVVTLGAASSVKATGTSRINYMTFSAPFALPGVSLPAGTYIFEMPAAVSAFDVVRVKSRDGQQLYLTAFTRTVARPSPRAAAPEIVFAEVPRGTTPPVKVWYPAGQQIGHEFIYPENSPQLGRNN